MREKVWWWPASRQWRATGLSQTRCGLVAKVAARPRRWRAAGLSQAWCGLAGGWWPVSRQRRATGLSQAEPGLAAKVVARHRRKAGHRSQTADENRKAVSRKLPCKVTRRSCTPATGAASAADAVVHV